MEATVDALSAIPALPVRNVESSVAFYRDVLGFECPHSEEGFAILQWGDVELHLWAATDESWRARTDGYPVLSGAESFIAGTASCRVEVRGVDALYDRLLPQGIVHPNGQLEDKPWGTREFAVLDPDNNLLTFFEHS